MRRFFFRWSSGRIFLPIDHQPHQHWFCGANRKPNPGTNHWSSFYIIQFHRPNWGMLTNYMWPWLALPYFNIFHRRKYNEIHLFWWVHWGSRYCTCWSTRHVGNHWVLLEVVTPMDSCHILSFCLIGISWYSIIVDQIVFWAPKFMGRYWTYCPPDSSRSTGKTHPFLNTQKTGSITVHLAQKICAGQGMRSIRRRTSRSLFSLNFAATWTSCFELDATWEVGLLVLFGLLSWCHTQHIIGYPRIAS